MGFQILWLEKNNSCCPWEVGLMKRGIRKHSGIMDNGVCFDRANVTYTKVLRGNMYWYLQLTLWLRLFFTLFFILLFTLSFFLFNFFYIVFFSHYHLVPLYSFSPHNHHPVVPVHGSFFLFAQSLYSLNSPLLGCHPALHLWVCL